MRSSRILVVDDMETMRALICAGLRGLGFTQIACAADGEAALVHLRSHLVDLVLLDAEMPRLNGLDTLRAIRSQPRFSNLVVIMVTGRADAGFIQQLALLKVDGYLVKPIAAVTLGARIDAALSRRASRTG